MAREERKPDRKALLYKKLCVLFDWSGTISDDAELTHASAEMIGKKFGYHVEKCTKKWANESLSSATAGTASTSCGRAVESSEIEKLHAEYVESLKSTFESLKPRPTKNVIQRLHALKLSSSSLVLGVVSAHPQVSLVSEARGYGLSPEVFQESMLFGGVTNKADFMRGFLTSLEVATNAPNAVYVGDSASDVVAAKKAGVVAVAVCGGYHCREKLESAKPDFVYESTSDFVDDFIAINLV